MKTNGYAIGCLGLLLTVGNSLGQSNFNRPATQEQSTWPGSVSKPSTQLAPPRVIAFELPALTDRAADAALEYFATMVSIIQGAENLEIDQKLRENWRAYLVSCWPDMDVGAREAMTSLSSLLVQLKQEWSRTPLANRSVVRINLSAQLPGILQITGPVVLCTPRPESRQSLTSVLWAKIQEQKAAMRLALQRYQQPQQEQRVPNSNNGDIPTQLSNHYRDGETVINNLNMGAANTLNQMRAMSSH